jgi:hypothetical protein
MFPTRRHGALGAGAALLALVALPSSAFAGHDLKIYKAEAQVDLASDENAFTVKCDPGDHALDGMWRIDHADQDDYIGPNELIRTAVDVVQAAPTADGAYSFTFEKNAIGRAQVKIFVTCLGDKTVGGGHTHSFPAPPAANPVFTSFSTTTTPVTGTGATLPVSVTSSACGPGTFLVSPGFAFSPSGWTDGTNPTDPTGQAGRLYESNYTSTANSTWRWGFDFSSLPSGYTASVTTTWRCLKLKVNPGSHDKHKLVVKQRSATRTVGPNGVKEVRLDCGSHEKAIVAGFTIDSSSTDPNSAFANLWYLGMDPRIKQRAYRFLNRHPSTAFGVLLKAACLNYRTT